MKHRLKLAGGMIAATLVFPAAAGAHQEPSVDTVRQHIRSADEALEHVSQLVADNDDAAAAIELARNHSQTRKAARDAAALRDAADTRADREDAAEATRKVARQYNANVELFAPIVDEVGADLALDVALELKSGLRGRELALDALTDLLPRLPVDAQEAISKVIANLSSDGKDEVADITEALDFGDLPVDVDEVLGDALDRALAGIDMGLERLNEVVDMLPPAARPYVEDAIDLVTEQLDRVKALLEDLLGGGLDGFLPDGVSDLLDGLFGGGEGDGDCPFPIPIPILC